MNNFYFQISNGLLKDNHEERMGAAVWTYMRLLDKITKIDEEGWGWILGGKPVNLEDFTGEKSTDTVSRNLQKLHKEKYISIKRTPNGLIIKVAKAKKSFRKSADSQKTNEVSETAKVPNLDRKSAVSETAKVRFADQISKVDKYSDTTIAAQDAADDGGLINSLIKEFEPVNPSVHKLYPNTTQRAALTRLLKKYGYDKVLGMVRSLPKSNASRYGPTITTPFELEEKLGKLVAFYQKEKQATKSRIIR